MSYSRSVKYSAPPSSASLGILERLRRRVSKMWRRTFMRGDITALLMSLGLLWMPALALHAAAWSEGLSVLFPIIVVALITSFLLARSQFSELGALFLGTIYGACTILLIHLIALPGPFSLQARVTELGNRIDQWSAQVRSGASGTDNLIFALFLSVLFWYLAHNTVWHIFRLDRIWRAIVPPGLVLVINNLYYIGDASLDFYLIGFLFFALLLIANSYIESREYEWYRNRIKYPVQVRQHFLRLGAALCIAVLIFSWLLPVGSGQDNWEKLKDFLGGDPLSRINELWNRLFASLEGQGIATTDYYGGDRLDLTGAVQLGDDPVMLIKVRGNPQGIRFYWRSTIFDFYDGRGWDHDRSVRAYKDDEGMAFNIGNYDARRDFSQEIIMYIPATSLVHAAPQTSAINDIAVEAELNCVQGGSNCVNQNQEADIAVIRSRDPLRINDTYNATSSLSIATADQLRNASIDYPSWVTRMYIQGGESVSPEVRSLTEQIISFSGAITPYDKAKAIEQWLRTNIEYDESISAPPLDRDPVDWFLFDIRRGYCNYYATAMIMMLRSQGIPSRMAAGFAQGTYQADQQAYQVKENDAHTWVEAYFPGYGWVEFEPTADETPLDRPGDVAFDSSFATVTPVPTPTETPFATPTLQPVASTPTPTPTQTLAPEQPEQGMTATPNIQPSQTSPATLTPTPADGPITNVEAGGDSGSFVRTLLILLAVMLLTILIMVGVVGFFVWWIEHRGLGGLNPIQKAYARLDIYGRWLGIHLSNRQTPEERRLVLVDEVPDGEEPITGITGLYTQDRYAPPIPPEQQHAAELDARRAWRDARISFILEKFRRWRGLE